MGDATSPARSAGPSSALTCLATALHASLLEAWSRETAAGFRDMILVSGLRVLCSRTAFCAISRGPDARRCPQDELKLLDNLRIHQTSIAILLVPLPLPGAWRR